MDYITLLPIFIGSLLFAGISFALGAGGNPNENLTYKVFILPVLFLSIFVVSSITAIISYNSKHEYIISEPYKVETVGNIDVITIDDEVINLNRRLGKDLQAGSNVYTLKQEPYLFFRESMFIIVEETNLEKYK